MENNNYVIIISAYNRPDALKNILNSLNNILTDKKIHLIISIDNQGTEFVNKIAYDFIWKHGKKEIVIHKQKKGLREHFIWIGDQTEKYENVLFLEDDLYVSPYILQFVEKAIEKYSNDDRITGISLYNPLISEFDKCKFFQIEDGYDNYFFQHPYWGNVWFKKQWEEFKKWLDTYEENLDLLPKSVQHWNETSFKKLYIQYMVEKDRYMVYPRVSYVTNMGEMGLHSKTNFLQFHTSLQMNSTSLRLSSFDDSSSIYDIFFEYSSKLLKKKIKKLREYDFCIDIRGVRTKFFTKYVLTSRKVDNYIFSFGSDFRPQEMNVLLDISGKGIYLAKVEDLRLDKNYLKKRIVDDILCRNYSIGFKEIVSCFIYTIKLKLGWV